MNDLSRLDGRVVQAKGRCRIDYTDPVTGKVLERIEGDNHVFTGQFCSASFQSSAFRSHLLLTDGAAALDTDLPWIPGWPVGYGLIGAEASGIYRGAYRSTASSPEVVTKSGVKGTYVYDFLPTQIPGPIGYIGLSGNYGVYAATAPFRYKWPVQSFSGIYDIARRLRFALFDATLPSEANGDGSVTVEIRTIVPPGSLETQSCTFQLFDLLGRPEDVWPERTYTSGNNTYNYSQTKSYAFRMGYDCENQRVVLWLTRCCYYYHGSSNYDYFVEMKDDVWALSLDASTQEAAVCNHYEHEWTAAELTQGSGSKYTAWYYYHPANLSGTSYSPHYFRFYNGIIYAFTTVPENDRHEIRSNIRIIKYSPVSGTFSESALAVSDGYTNVCGAQLFCYKGYTWPNAQTCSLSGNNFDVVPMYNVYDETVYATAPTAYAGSSGNGYSRFLEKGILSAYPDTWTLQPSTNENDWADRIYVPTMPFAYTAYKVPSDAPARPANSAVTVSYELTVNW